MWDFAGMTKERKPFRHIESPLGAYQLRAIDYSPDGNVLVLAGSSNQPVLIDREGHVIYANPICLPVSVRHRRALRSDIREGSMSRENREDRLPSHPSNIDKRRHST